MNTRSEARLTAILALSVLLRVLASIALRDQLSGLPGTADQLSYHTLALRLLEGNGFSFAERWWPVTAAGAPTAHWSYLYTYFLAAIYAIFGSNPLAARLIQSVMVGILHPLLAYLLGRRIFGEAVGLAGAAVTAVYAYFVYYTATLMTEPFFFTAILASLYLAIRLADRAREGAPVRLDVIRLGLAFGTAALLRQLFLLFVPILLIWVWVTGRPHLGWRALLPGLVVIAMVLPFTVYNMARFDRFVLLNTNAGYAFFWANHPIYGTHFVPILTDEMGSYQALIPAGLRGLDEAALDSALLKRGIGFVIDDPVRYLRLSISRIPEFFKFWPTSESGTLSNLARVLSFGMFLPWMLLGLIRSWFPSSVRLLREPVGLLSIFVAVYSAIHLLSWSLIRYRLPIDAVLVLFAGSAIVELANRAAVRGWLATRPLA